MASVGRPVRSGDKNADGGIVVDVVRGEGAAVGREWPLWLVLGRDAYTDVRAKCERVLRTMDAWEDVATEKLEFPC